MLEVIAGILLASIGWIVSHKLALNAQRRHFHDQLLDRARLEIVGAIHSYQRWLSKLSAELLTADSEFVFERSGLRPNWMRHVVDIQSLMNSSSFSHEWSTTLQEYEILFPETAQVRAELLRRQSTIFELVQELHMTLLGFLLPGLTLVEREKAIAHLKEKHSDFLSDQAALLEDLRIHMQNASLSEIAGRRIPDRQPSDLSLPKIVMGNDGMLRVGLPSEAAQPPGVTVRDQNAP